MITEELLSEGVAAVGGAAEMRESSKLSGGGA